MYLRYRYRGAVSSASLDTVSKIPPNPDETHPDLQAVFGDIGAKVGVDEVERDVGEVHCGVERGEGEGGDPARLVEGGVVVHRQHSPQPVLPQGGQHRPLFEVE